MSNSVKSLLILAAILPVLLFSDLSISEVTDKPDQPGIVDSREKNCRFFGWKQRRLQRKSTSEIKILDLSQSLQSISTIEKALCERDSRSAMKVFEKIPGIDSPTILGKECKRHKDCGPSARCVFRICQSILNM